MFLARKSAVVGIITGAAIAFGAIGANAATYTYDLFDHEDGSETAYDYGLRLDQENPRRFFSFTQGSAQLIYDDVNMTASIGGTMRESFAGDGNFGNTFSITYTITGLEDLGTGSFRATGGSGMIDGISLGAEALMNGNDAGYSFILRHDGHRIDNDTTSTVGRGWVSKVGGANDFLFRTQLSSVEVVPLPATGLLLLGAFGGLAGMRRLRRKA